MKTVNWIIWFMFGVLAGVWIVTRSTPAGHVGAFVVSFIVFQYLHSKTRPISQSRRFHRY